MKLHSHAKILIRYFILLAFAFIGFEIFYTIFLPLTLSPTHFILDLFYDSFLVGHTIFIGFKEVSIVGACIAGSAYSLYLILNLSTGEIPIKKRLGLLAFGWGSFYLINLLRILILSIMFINGSIYFDILHKVLWYFGSTIFVIGIWFLGIYLFKIKNVPIYSDLKYLYSKSLFSKWVRRQKASLKSRHK